MVELSYDFAVVVGVYTLLAAVTDIRQHRIPNYLTVPAALLGLAYHTFMPHGAGVLFSLAGFVIGFCLLLAPWLLGGGGMGDVKLLAALGAWLGPYLLLIGFAGSAFLAAVMALSMILYRSLTDGVTRAKRDYLAVNAPTDDQQRKRVRRRAVPFAVPVALSTWLVMAWMLFKHAQ